MVIWRRGREGIPSRGNRMNQGREACVHMRYVVITVLWQSNSRCFSHLGSKYQWSNISTRSGRTKPLSHAIQRKEFWIGTQETHCSYI